MVPASKCCYSNPIGGAAWAAPPRSYPSTSTLQNDHVLSFIRRDLWNFEWPTHAQNVFNFVRPCVRPSVRRAGRPNRIEIYEFWRSKNSAYVLKIFVRSLFETHSSIIFGCFIAPGRSWTLPAAPGHSWTLLAAPGRSQPLPAAPFLIAPVRPAGRPKATRKNEFVRRSKSIQHRSKSIQNR